MHKTDKTADSTELEQALVAALSRFECIVYKRVADPKLRSISSKTHGSWDHRCTFEPLVNEAGTGDRTGRGAGLSLASRLLGYDVLRMRDARCGARL